MPSKNTDLPKALEGSVLRRDDWDLSIFVVSLVALLIATYLDHGDVFFGIT